jgi:hypothetical protein
MLTSGAAVLSGEGLDQYQISPSGVACVASMKKNFFTPRALQNKSLNQRMTQAQEIITYMKGARALLIFF